MTGDCSQTRSLCVIEQASVLLWWNAEELKTAYLDIAELVPGQAKLQISLGVTI